MATFRDSYEEHIKDNSTIEQILHNCHFSVLSSLKICNNISHHNTGLCLRHSKLKNNANDVISQLIVVIARKIKIHLNEIDKLKKYDKVPLMEKIFSLIKKYPIVLIRYQKFNEVVKEKLEEFMKPKYSEDEHIKHIFNPAYYYKCFGYEDGNFKYVDEIKINHLVDEIKINHPVNEIKNNYNIVDDKRGFIKHEFKNKNMNNMTFNCPVIEGDMNKYLVNYK